MEDILYIAIRFVIYLVGMISIGILGYEIGQYKVFKKIYEKEWIKWKNKNN